MFQQQTLAESHFMFIIFYLLSIYPARGDFPFPNDGKKQINSFIHPLVFDAWGNENSLDAG